MVVLVVEAAAFAKAEDARLDPIVHIGLMMLKHLPQIIDLEIKRCQNRLP